VTPVVAVLRELRQHNSDIDIRFWCDRKFAPQARSILGNFDDTIRIDTVVAGKLRRYHHLSFLQHIFIPSVFWPNVRDLFLVIVGIIQSICKLLVWRPDVVFTKGGYVCLPVGWAARLLRIPLVIHDSDAHPGLTNRLLARSAKYIATGAPLEYYSYPKNKSAYVGVPVSDKFKPFDDEQRRAGKRSLGVDTRVPLIVITGGGLGARRINDSVAFHLDELLQLGTVVLISGAAQYDELRALTPQNDPRFQLHAFVSQEMVTMLGCADVVVSRAGQTTILELAALAKPTILVPNGQLTGGHQLKNAKVYADKSAVIIVDDDQLEDTGNASIVTAVKQVLSDDELRHMLSSRIHEFAKPDAARHMAKIILQSVRS
jgi:UDP-N-acetylglucosamine--N-acetylmuramyl-(pentapeptide) pyrophosphoryl-undecaprenol N-acetylglucosamine transferase